MWRWDFSPKMNKRGGSNKACSWEFFLKKNKKNSMLIKDFRVGPPKRHLFDRQFCVGLLHIFCKHGPKGRGKIFKFWPLQSVRQKGEDFKRSFITCFLGQPITTRSPTFSDLSTSLSNIRMKGLLVLLLKHYIFQTKWIWNKVLEHYTLHILD